MCDASCCIRQGSLRRSFNQVQSLPNQPSRCFPNQTPFFSSLIPLSDEKDGLRHTVFYTAQFRSDLHAAARCSLHDDTPSRHTVDGAESEDDCAPSSDEDVAASSTSKAKGAQSAVESLEEENGCGNVPPSASKEANSAGRPELLGDDTPSSVGWSESLSPYRFSVLFSCYAMNLEQFLPLA